MPKKKRRKVKTEWKSDKGQITEVWYEISPEILLKPDETQVREIELGKKPKERKKET